jgi:hypothetical protein
VGVAVTSEIHVCAVERALKFGVDSADWADLGEYSAQSLAPCRRTPTVCAHNRFHPDVRRR